MRSCIFLCACVVCIAAPVYAQWQVAVFPYENRSQQSDKAWFERAFVEAMMYAYYRVPQVRVVDEDILRESLGDQWANLVGNRTLADRALIHIVLRGHYLFGQDSVQIQTDIVEAESGKVRRSVVSRAVELLDGTIGGLYLYRPDQDVLEWAVATDPSTPTLGSILRRGEGLSGKIWETGEPLIVDDYRSWEGRAEVYEKYSFAAVVGAPVHWRATSADEELL